MESVELPEKGQSLASSSSVDKCEGRFSGREVEVHSRPDGERTVGVVFIYRAAKVAGDSVVLNDREFGDHVLEFLREKSEVEDCRSHGESSALVRFG